MWECFKADIVADDITELENNLLSLLLFDRSSRKNIIWTTKNLLRFYLMSQIVFAGGLVLCGQILRCFGVHFIEAGIIISL